MNSFLARHQGVLLAGTALVAIVALIVALIASVRLNEVEDELAIASNNLDRVQAGTAVFAAQLTMFQENISTAAPDIDQGLNAAIDGLDSFMTSTLTFDVTIDEQVTVDTEIVLDREVLVPIQTSIPINETVETTITVAGPFGVDIPINVTVPINLEVPVDLEVTIPINETIPISTEIPIQITVPISLEVAETELATLAHSLRAGLISFRDVLTALG